MIRQIQQHQSLKTCGAGDLMATTHLEPVQELDVGDSKADGQGLSRGGAQHTCHRNVRAGE